MKNLSYEEARNEIKSGDIISFFSSHESSFIHRIITMFILYFTGSKIYHTGIAMWMTSDSGNRRLMLIEAVGVGRRILDLSYFRNEKMEIHPVPNHLDRGAIEFFLMAKIGKQGYGFWNLIAIALREFFGIKAKDTKGQVCSQLAALSWAAGGMQFEETSVSPGKLRNILIKNNVPPYITINSTRN